MLNVQQVGPWQTIRFQLPDGDAGTADTISYIRQLVDEGLTDPRVRRLATEIVRSAGVAPFDDLGEVRAIFEWVRDAHHIRFFRDMVGKEMLQPAWSIIESQAGDCDCINAILLPSLLGAIGYPTRAVTVASDPADAGNFSHIFIEVLVNQDRNGGDWIPLDVARPGARWGRVPERFWRLRRWPLMDSADTGESGVERSQHSRAYLNGLRQPRGGVMRTRRIMPRFGLGRLGQDDDDGSTLQDLSQALTPVLQTIPGIETGVAQIVKAGNTPTSGSALPVTTAYPQSGTAVLTASTGGTSLFTIGLVIVAGIIGIKMLGK
jgi:hypothetical protein